MIPHCFMVGMCLVSGDTTSVTSHLWRFWDSTGAPIAVVAYEVKPSGTGPKTTRVEVTSSIQQPLPLGSVVVSDLAFGVPATAQRWQVMGYTALLGLSGTFAPGDSVHLFYQVRSDSSHEDVRTWITVTDVTNATHGKRIMQMSFPGRLNTGVNVAERVLDMARQKPGKYLVELQVGDLHGGGTSVRSAQFTLVAGKRTGKSRPKS